jgi:hypothetical protein
LKTTTTTAHIDIAFQLFDRMQNDFIYPTDLTYLYLLELCTHTGYLEQGFSLLEDMKKFYMKPNAYHYRWLVDGCIKKKDFPRMKEVYEMAIRNTTPNLALLNRVLYGYSVLGIYGDDDKERIGNNKKKNQKKREKEEEAEKEEETEMKMEMKRKMKRKMEMETEMDEERERTSKIFEEALSLLQKANEQFKIEPNVITFRHLFHFCFMLSAASSHHTHTHNYSSSKRNHALNSFAVATTNVTLKVAELMKLAKSYGVWLDVECFSLAMQTLESEGHHSQAIDLYNQMKQQQQMEKIQTQTLPSQKQQIQKNLHQSKIGQKKLQNGPIIPNENSLITLINCFGKLNKLEAGIELLVNELAWYGIRPTARLLDTIETHCKNNDQLERVHQLRASLPSHHHA